MGCVAITVLGGAAVGAPVLAVFVAEGVTVPDGVKVEVPGEHGVFGEWAVAKGYQDGERWDMVNVAPLGAEGAVDAGVGVHAGLGR